MNDTIATDLSGEMKSNHFQIIFRNLLSNAIKFSKEDSTVELMARAEKGKIWVTIKDYGVGINPDEVHQLQTDKGISQSTFGTKHESGTGIGLTVCKELLQHNDETWAIESEKDKGTSISFSVNIPG